MGLIFSQSHDPNSNNQTGAFLTVCALLNGMIGGTILILPIISLSAGYLTTIFVSVSIGFISCFTANLIVVHLGKANNMKQSILNHFDQSHAYVVAYAFIIWAGQIPLLMIYFNLICLQIQGLIGQHEWISYAVAAALILQTFISAMGIGIVSIACYLAFIGWALATSPGGEKQVPMTGNPYHLAQTLFVAYSIHDIIIQNIIKNPKREEYTSIIITTFAIATVAYTFVAFGSFAIVNRQSWKMNPQTVQDYFQVGGFVVSLIELLYFLHLFTVYPQYLRVSKIRFFDAFKIQNKRNLQWKQSLYISIIIGVCMLINKLQVKLNLLISIISATSGSLLIIIIPVCIHIKCVYLDGNCGSIVEQNADSLEINVHNSDCQYYFTKKIYKYLQMPFLVLLLLFGLAAFVTSSKDALFPS